MRVLVTGGSGFLGSHIAEELVRRGHDVVSLDDRDPPTADYAAVIGDIRDREVVDRAMAGCEAVYHCAAIADLDQARSEPRRATEVNVLGTLAVLEAAASLGVNRFMHASSVYVYARGGSVYRTTKRAAEGLVGDLSGAWGLQSTILRFGSLYGPRADANNAISRLIHQAVSQKRIDFWGNGSEVREYVHILDAASLAVDALDETYAGQALHVTGHERMTTREVIEMITEMIGEEIEVNFNDEPFEGRFRLSPYALDGNSGRRMMGRTYVDLGLGLLELMRDATEAPNSLRLRDEGDLA